LTAKDDVVAETRREKPGNGTRRLRKRFFVVFRDVVNDVIFLFVVAMIQPGEREKTVLQRRRDVVNGTRLAFVGGVRGANGEKKRRAQT
jgi:hypothetical protein